MSTNQYTTERRPRAAYAGPVLSRCFVCRNLAKPKTHSRDRRGQIFMVCRSCSIRYDDPVGQAAKYGPRFRFVRRDEIPHPDSLGISERNMGPKPWYTFHQVFKTLLLYREHRLKRQKEVMWTVDEMTERYLKLLPRIAAVIRDTYEIRGDDFKLENDVAITKIRDLCEEIDPLIFKRRRISDAKRKRRS